MSDYTPSETAERIKREWLATHAGSGFEDLYEAEFDRMIAQVKVSAIREYVDAARENPHTNYWPPSGVLDDAEQWAEEIEKGTI